MWVTVATGSVEFPTPVIARSLFEFVVYSDSVSACPSVVPCVALPLIGPVFSPATSLGATRSRASKSVRAITLTYTMSSPQSPSSPASLLASPSFHSDVCAHCS